MLHDLSVAITASSAHFMREAQRDAIEERAAILEFDAGMTRDQAELEAARMHGFKDWNAAMTAISKEER